MSRTEFEIIKEQLELLKVAFDASYDGFHILDSEGNTLMISKACERIEGISYEAVAHKNIRQLVEEGYFSDSVTLKVLAQKQPVTMIQKVKNGNEVLVTGIPVYKNGQIDKVIINSRDITELNMLKRKLSENELLAEKYQSEWQKLNSKMLRQKELLYTSEAMNKTISMALNVAKVDSNILITGESGTGKGLLSKFIHDNSSNSSGAFVKIDCATIPESLFESELFGYEKGTFTGADVKGKVGLVQLADKGTLFLDEIGEVPISMQGKLLRLLQDKTIYKVGGKDAITVDCRIIAATNRDLAKMVEDGSFREDLYYRLNVIPIWLPPLRERKEDIPLMVIHLLEKLNSRYHTEKKISMAVMDKLIEYDWPGNVRELENVVERLAILSEGDTIEINDLPTMVRGHAKQTPAETGLSLKQMLDSYEKSMLASMLGEGLSIFEIARKLQIDATTVRRKLHKFEIAFK